MSQGDVDGGGAAVGVGDADRHLLPGPQAGHDGGQGLGVGGGLPTADWLPGSAGVTGPGRLRSSRQGLPPEVTGTYASARPMAGGAPCRRAERTAMSGYPGIRASDEDRGRIAAALGEHYAAGRLTLEEFQDRLDKAYAAATVGELDRLMADLPGTDLGRLPERRAPGPVQVPAGGSVLAWRAAWRFWLTVSVIAFVIWLLGGAGGPWFLWVAIPLGLLMLRRWMAGGPRRDGRP